MIWNRWMPRENLKRKYYVDEICDDIERGLVIELSDEDREKIVLNWHGVVDSYMCTEESSRSKLCYDNPDVMKWTFFEITGSEYIQWVCEQSLGIQQSDTLHHFCIVGINAVVDIIASYPPIILSENDEIC